MLLRHNINWSLAKYELENLDNYDNVINILRNVENDYPEFIIDKVILLQNYLNEFLLWLGSIIQLEMAFMN